ERRYVNPDWPKFLRRALWLFPYNGCFTRAAHVAQSFERQGVQRPGKVYAFGDLGMKTPYDPSGSVSWSYHVAAAFRVDNEAVILDPAIKFDALLSLKEWLKAISSNVSDVKIAICDTFSYSPIDDCVGGDRDQERSLVTHTVSYLPD